MTNESICYQYFCVMFPSMKKKKIAYIPVHSMLQYFVLGLISNKDY